MAKVGDAAHTPHGLGTITEVDTVRGRSSFRVAGNGFNIWVDETKLHVANNSYLGGLETTIDPGDINEDNHTTLPYDPSPQYPTDLFAKEQTILPGDYEIDRDDRLHPSDSLSGDRKSPNRPYPGPNPDLFAKEGAQYFYGELEDYPDRDDQGDDEWNRDIPDPVERTFGKDAGLNTYRPAGLSDRYAHFDIEAGIDDSPVAQFRRDPAGFIEIRGAMHSDGDDYLELKYADHTNLIDIDDNLRTASWNDVRSKAMRLRREGRVKVYDVSPVGIFASVEGDHGTYETMIAKTGSMGGYGGGQSISNWHCGCEWGRWAFKRKMSFVGRLCSHAYAAYLDMQSAYHQGNPGKFHAKSAGVVDQFKTWCKDNDQSPEPSSIANFAHNSDDDLDEDQIQQLYDYVDKNPDETPERKYDVGYELDPDAVYKEADVLHTRPQSLTPSMHAVPEGEEHQWVDVTKDDRETTGPDQIMHFSAIARMLHGGPGDPPAPPAPDGSQPGSGGTSKPLLPGLMNTLHNWNNNYNKTINPPAPTTQPPNPVPAPGLPKPAPGPTPAPADTQGNHPWGSLAGSDLPGAPPAPPGGPSLAGDHRPAPPPPLAPGIPSGNGGNIGKPGGPGLNPGGTPVENGPAPVGKGPIGSPGGPKLNPGGDSSLNTTYNPASGGGVDPSTGNWNKSPDSSGISGDSYRINAGDTLNDIAQRSGLSVGDIQKANPNITDINKINAGDTLKMPGASGAGSPGTTLAPAPVAPGKPPAMPPAPAAENPGAGQAPAPGYVPPGGSRGGNGLWNPTPAAENPGAGEAPAPGYVPPGGSRGNNGLWAPNRQGSLAAFLHYAADDDDDDNDDADHRPDTGQAGKMLDRLREISQQSPSEHYHNMADHNDEVADLVEKLQDAGVDATPMVASLHYADTAADGNPDFLGQSSPGWADEPFAGSGPDPKGYMSDSASYVDEHERPDFIDVTDLDADDGDIIKFNDSRSAPPQGPRHTSRQHYADQGVGSTLGDFGEGSDITPNGTLGDFTNPGDMGGGAGDILASLHYADDGGDTGYFNPANPSDSDWQQGDWVGHAENALQNAGPQNGDGLPQAPGHAGGDEAAVAGEGGAAGGEAAELAPLLLASRDHPGSFSLEAFDRGEFSPGGDLRRAGRVGNGPSRQVRVDPGFRGQSRPRYAQAPPEDFGNDGEPDLSAYGGVDGGTDIVAAFQRSGGARAVMSNQVIPDDFSSSPYVQSMLRTAGRKYSPEEQRMLEAEAHPMGARNLPTDDDLQGTHYLLGL